MSEARDDDLDDKSGFAHTVPNDEEMLNGEVFVNPHSGYISIIVGITRGAVFFYGNEYRQFGVLPEKVFRAVFSQRALMIESLLELETDLEGLNAKLTRQYEERTGTSLAAN